MFQDFFFMDSHCLNLEESLPNNVIKYSGSKINMEQDSLFIHIWN